MWEAATLNGNLTLDAEGNPDAIFIFQINGAFCATSTFASVTLINAASLCNVHWQTSTENSILEIFCFSGYAAG
ncbi:MAG: DUF3494 domain-containing protein [Saprospiraceae bacterium]|nr:DUF3494 domain-containing protein [Saprospiraceae bacterium]